MAINLWSEQEIQLLKSNHNNINYLINLLPNRTREAIQTKKNRLGITEKISWSKEEIEYLKQNYFNTPNKILNSQLNHSTDEIKHKAFTLNLKKEKNNINLKDYRSSIHIGKHLGHKSWNKGLTKETDIRLSNYGKKISKIKRGKPTWNKGLTLTEEHKKKLSETRKKLISEGKISRVWNFGLSGADVKSHYKKTPIGLPKGFKFDAENKQKHINYLINWFKDERNRIKNRQRLENMWTPELKEKQSQNYKIKWANKEFREKQLKKILSSLLKRPTSFEKKVNQVIIANNLPYKYVGNGEFIIGYKNPDFINVNGEKICIEVYNNYHHPKDYEQIRSNYFKQYGWKTLFVSEDEINSNITILNKIKGDKIL